MKIFVVDDDPMQTQMLSHILVNHGHDVVTAHCGREAMERISQDDFDLIITDLIMAEKGGMDVIEEVKELNPAMKVIAISAGGRVGYSSLLELAKACGADAVLQKPLQASDVMEAIERVNMPKPAIKSSPYHH